MNQILPYILATLTQNKRYLIKRPYIKNSWTGNMFAFWENIAGIPHGIRKESVTDIKTGTHISFTVRDFFTHGEVVVRKFFKEFKFEVVPVPMLVTESGMTLPLGLFPKIKLAIAYVSATSSSSDTTSVDAGSASNRIFIEASCGPVSDSWTATAWNGESLTKYLNSLYAAVGRYNYFWACYPVGTGAHNLVNTGPGGDYSSTYAMIYSSVKQTGSPKNVGMSTGTGTSGSRSITANNGDWLVGGGGNDAAGIVAGTNTRLISAFSSQGQGDSNGVASPTALAFTFGGGSANWSAYGGAIEPFTASGPANVKTVNGLAIASVKNDNGLAIASVKTMNGLN